MYKRWKFSGKSACVLACLIAVSLGPIIGHTQDMDRTGTRWAPYMEWSLQNPDYSGNPFDLIATVTFTHGDSNEQRVTEMFYAGGSEWRFRFTGTQIGSWTFRTNSTDGDLDGRTGTVVVEGNPDPNIRGFIGAIGNKFAKQSADGDFQATLFNVYMNDADFPYQANLSEYSDPNVIQGYLDDAQKNGFSTIYFALNHNWLSLGANAYTEHSSVNPDLNTFELLDAVIAAAHARGMSMHFWAWGDETRKWTPIGLEGGINGTVDRRLQRYIAARLGPLPGWTMGYGFDLQEWVNNEQVGSWAKYLRDRMGWDHMLWARGRDHPDLSAIAYSGFSDFGYADARSRLQSDETRPHIYSERFLYERRAYWDMDGTRQKLWQYAMAGGMGSWWGVAVWANPGPYPNPEQLQTHSRFWADRFSADLVPTELSAEAFVQRSSDHGRFILYQEGTDSITADLTTLAATAPAIAVDTKSAYRVIDLGEVSPSRFEWVAPTTSDWAIAIGFFDARSNSEDTKPRPPENLVFQ